MLSVAAFRIFRLAHTNRKKIQNIFPVSGMYKPVPMTTMNWDHIWSSRDRRQLKSKCSWEDGIHLEINWQKEGNRLSTKIMRGRSWSVWGRSPGLEWNWLICALQIKHFLQCCVWRLWLSWGMRKCRIYLLGSWTSEIFCKIKLLIKRISAVGEVERKVTSSVAQINFHT